MRPIFSDKITIEPEDAYIAVLRFLDTYNEELQSDELMSLIGEMIQVGIAQSTYRLWLKTFRDVLIESGDLKEANDAKTILPDTITTRSIDIYRTLIGFLEKYNEDLQSDDLKYLIGKLTLIDGPQNAYKLWLEALKAVILEK